MNNQNPGNVIQKIEDTRQEEKVEEQKQDRTNKVVQYCFGDLSKSKVKALGIYFVMISVLEILAYVFQGIYSFLAARIWFVGGFLCVVSILAYFVKGAKVDIKKQKFISVAFIILLVIYLVMITGNMNLTEINPDAAQQAAAGMDSFHSSDFNYTGKAFLGYPNRQYIIAALPALLLGRSILTLHLGFALPFILGILTLYCAFREWAKKLNINTELAILSLFALFIFPFVTEYYANFEQAIYPISFTMISIGFFLLILCKPNVLNIFGLAWTGCLLSNSYTPALATLGLLLVFIALAMVTLLIRPSSMPFRIKKSFLTAKVLLFSEINIICFLVATLLEKRQDRITQLRSDGNRISMSIKSILDFLTDKNAIFMGMFGVIVILYLVASLTLRLKIRDLLISLWILGVFAVSNLLTGYTAYQPAWNMQRAMTVIPVLITGVTLTLFQMIKNNNLKIKRGTIVAMVVAFSFIGLNNFNRINQSFTYFNYVQPMKYMLEDLEKSVKKNNLNCESEFNILLYTENVAFKNLADYCKFFYPDANVYIQDYGTYPYQMITSMDTFIYGDSELSKDLPVSAENVVAVHDTRHNLDIIWYKGSMIN